MKSAHVLRSARIAIQLYAVWCSLGAAACSSDTASGGPGPAGTTPPALACNPDRFRCSSGRVEKCAADGSEWLLQLSCDDAEACVRTINAGADHCLVCEAGTARCIGASLILCDATGGSETTEDCGERVCNSLSGRCEAKDITELITLPAPVSGTFQIDAHEVTGQQYSQHASQTLGHMPECDFGGTSPVDDAPVTCVNWTDAEAYCAWAGKRMCDVRTLSGNPWGPDTDPEIPNTSEWVNACSSGMNHSSSLYAWGYGPKPECLDRAPVGSRPQCSSTTTPYDQLDGMSGNLEEWVGFCDGHAASTGAQLCEIRGRQNGLCQWRNTMEKDFRSDRVTFRCCGLP